MKPIMKFYATVLSYLQSDIEDSTVIEQIESLAQNAKPSWETNWESITHLEKCVNRGSLVSDDEVFTIRNDFAKAAFRDLSVIRDDKAMDLFGKVADAVVPTYSAGEDMFVWARSVKDRPDGSGVLVVHVTDLKRFRDLIEEHNLVDKSGNFHTLEDGVLIGS